MTGVRRGPALVTGVVIVGGDQRHRHQLQQPHHPHHPREEEQVVLVDVGGSWEYLDSGTVVDCNDPATLLPETVTACEALGLL